MSKKLPDTALASHVSVATVCGVHPDGGTRHTKKELH